MNHRKLGNTGLEVSEISFGTVELGLPYGIGVDSADDMINESDAVKLLHTAVDKGINFFDTAAAYGASEKILGQALKNLRDQVIICTKPAHLYQKNLPNPPKTQIKKIIDQSLNNSLNDLQTDYLDVYMLHDNKLSISANPDVWEIFCDYRNKGVVRAIGISTFLPEETKAALDAGVWDVIQLPYNLMDQRQEPMIRRACQQGVGIVVRSVLMKGVLTSRGDSLHPALNAVQQHRRVYEQLLSDTASTLSDLAVKFVLSHDEVTSLLIGIDRLEFLESALTLADGHYLDNITLQKAQRLSYPDPDFLDLHEWDVQGWLR